MLPQISQFCFFRGAFFLGLFSWTRAIWRLKYIHPLNTLLQRSQVNVFASSVLDEVFFYMHHQLLSAQVDLVTRIRQGADLAKVLASELTRFLMAEFQMVA